MKALSVRQPWAWAILHAGKDIENRTWETRHRGPVVLHAGRAWHAVGPAELGRRMGIRVPPDLPRGGLVGVVTITGCVRDSESPWWLGPIGFVLRDAVEIPFIACAGKLGLYDLEPADRAAVLDACPPGLAAALVAAERRP